MVMKSSEIKMFCSKIGAVSGTNNAKEVNFLERQTKYISEQKTITKSCKINNNKR